MGNTNGQPEALKAALETIPEVMAALMREFIAKKDVTTRIQIRLRMKALLDFVGVDTEYPPNPLKKSEARAEPAREAAMRDGAQLGLQAYPAVGVAEQAAAPPPPPPRVGIDNSNIVQ